MRWTGLVSLTLNLSTTTKLKETMMDANEIQGGLSGFYGTEGYHRFSVLCPKLLLTDGAKWLAENAGAYWLMDAIGSHQPKAMKDDKGMLQNMQFWSLKKSQKSRSRKI